MKLLEEQKKSQPAKVNPVKRFFGALGPGLVTGAADDDPSGIATYSIAGAQFGTSFLWLAWFTWPLMLWVQMTCARIGMMSGHGLAGALGKKFPRWVILVISVALFVANTINIAADLSGMGDAANMLSGLSGDYFVVMFGLFIGWAIVKFRYHHIANILKWLALSLFAYIITAFIINANWDEIAKATLTVKIPNSNDGWGMLVAILGTTISPYLFFWQSAQEVEERKAKGRRMVSSKLYLEKHQLTDRIIDVSAGTFLSNIVMFFIIVTTAFTLHQHGITEISTSKEAATALKPLAGNWAALLYTLGLVSTGLLAIPTLAGSSAYAFAEIFNWDYGLDEKLINARAFYMIIIVSVICGIGLDFLNINPMKALYWSAIINGLIAPFIMVGIIVVAADSRIMRKHESSYWSLAIVTIATLVMFAAAIGMFIF